MKWELIIAFQASFTIILVTCSNLVSTDCFTPSLANGKLVYERFEDFKLATLPENYVLKFRCMNGYEKIGPHFVVCQKGRWNKEPPKCLFLECSEPPEIGNGSSKYNQRLIGSIARYNCKPGFEFWNENASSLVCSVNGTEVEWTGEMPSCIEKRACPEPGVSGNGFRRGSCCYVGDVAIFGCDEGYELIGSEHIQCLKGGIWSGKRPRCKPSAGHCEDPPVIENGVVTGLTAGDYYVPYEEAEVVCNPGFANTAYDEFIMCQENYEWEKEFGICKETFCDIPEPPANGSILEMQSTTVGDTVNNASKIPYNYEVTYTCDDGFRLIGSAYRKCDKGNNWTTNEPRCEVIRCHNPGRPKHGDKIGVDFRVGQKVQFVCPHGFDLLGSVERYCMPNGQWSGELASCNLRSNYCPDPGIPINGRKNGNRYQEGDRVRFHCYPGFSLVGTAIRRCLPDRTWSGQEAKCIGSQDFDNPSEVSQTLQESLNEKIEEQEMELFKFNSNLQAATGFTAGGKRKAIQTQRILNLNYPGRYILYFVFDVSGSVKLRNFNISIKFAKALVKKVGISEYGARAGALTFSTKAEIIFNPVQYSTTEDVLDALDKINYTRGGTATTSALRLVREGSMPLTREYLGVKGVKSVVFMLTDGKANMGGSPKEQAILLKEAGVEIYCIGITGNIMKNGLYEVASLPLNEHVFVLNNYKTLEWLIQEITNGTIDYSECGVGLDKVGKSGHRSRIIGGKKAVEPWPWIAALYITDSGPSEAELKCGGTIIGPKWILTAAHCICKKDQSVHRDIFSVYVKLGLADVDNVTSHVKQFEVAHFYTHENYDPSTLNHDIGLIELNQIIEYTPYVRPICLPPDEIPEDSPLYKTKQNAYAAGWGHTEVVRKGEFVKVKGSKNMKELLLPIQSKKTCVQSILDSGFEREIYTDVMICAGSGDGNADMCQGDSGGPLMQSQLNEHGNIFWTLVGVVSWGDGCGQVNTYGVYTSVHKELSWIKTILQTHQ